MERSDGHHQRGRGKLDDTNPRIPTVRKTPNDSQKARKIRIKAPLYRMINNDLYRKTYLSTWIRCVRPTQAKSIIKEIHQGSCRMHAGPRSVVSKITKLGYYWPSMHSDAKTLIQRREACQIHLSIQRKLKHEMKSITSAWSFSQWGIDIVRPLPLAPGGARFGTPHIVISDNRKQFAEGTFPVFCQKLGILQAFTSVYHQANEHVRVNNRDIVKGMNLVYGSEAVVPIEISMETKRIKEFEARQNEKKCREDLDILEEKRKIASIREAYYKQNL
nr:reverse transcriptase domain-containing protein [Tanacetum cinerariifolium]